MRIHSNYAGGNIKVLEINNHQIILEQELRDTPQWWFYWSFCVESPIVGEFVFKFCNGDVIGPWGPAISFDRINWNWAGKASRISPSEFSYTFQGTEKEVYFCYSLPYQVYDFEQFYTRYSHFSYIKKEVLAVSEKGREVPLLIIGRPEAKKHIFLSCRHHACESVASYVLEGLLDYVVHNENSVLMQNYQLHIVPFIDIDGVEEGDQGKGRQPHDHNRDYIEQPVYKSIAAWMEYARQKMPEIFIDLHCPWKWGVADNIAEQRNNHPFFTKMLPPIKDELEKLEAVLSVSNQNDHHGTGIIFHPKYDICIGDDWFQPGAPTASAFFEKLGSRISATLEFPYFGTEDMIITQQNSRCFGKSLARALETYIINSIMVER